MTAESPVALIADPTTDYARQVVAGEVVASRLIRLACERHLRDIDEGPARGLQWDPEAAQHIFDFALMVCLPEVDGEAGKPFILQPWQMFVLGCLFGWKKANGYRRFRVAYMEIAKGSGKSPLAALIGLYGLLMDGEAAAEVLSAATAQHQAAILFRDAKIMAESSPSLRRKLTITDHNIAFERNNSFFRPVSAEHRGLDGKRPHFGLIDELHEHPNAKVVDKIRAGAKGRRQPLFVEITNAGFDRHSVCWQHHDYSVKILRGALTNDSWFAFICGLDPCEEHWGDGYTQPVDGCKDCDDWQDESKWIKANPNLGVSVTVEYLRDQVKQAVDMPALQNLVKRLNFCIWVDVATRLIPMAKWHACACKPDMDWLKKRVCYGGLDVGAISDFLAFTLLFPHDDGEAVQIPINNEDPTGPKKLFVRRTCTLLTWLWLPEQAIRRDSQMEDTFALWRNQGHIRTTPGDCVDHDTVVDDVLKIIESYQLQEIGLDMGFQGLAVAVRLMRHLGEKRVKYCRQGIFTLAGPFREFLQLILQKRLRHDNNPAMNWMAGNTVGEERSGLIKPSKDKSTEKIDGITAATMSFWSMMNNPQQSGGGFESW